MGSSELAYLFGPARDEPVLLTFTGLPDCVFAERDRVFLNTGVSDTLIVQEPIAV